MPTAAHHRRAQTALGGRRLARPPGSSRGSARAHPSDEAVMRGVWGGAPFVFPGPARWNALGLGTTAALAPPLVYNTKPTWPSATAPTARNNWCTAPSRRAWSHDV
ncbi:MAG: hypothetical protein IPL79_00070 [Myxococcales bacterium]|nr:hypothetical protein [Myxococcales bacterium]